MDWIVQIYFTLQPLPLVPITVFETSNFSHYILLLRDNISLFFFLLCFTTEWQRCPQASHLWARDVCQCQRPHREKATLSRHAGVLHDVDGECRMQLWMRILPELGFEVFIHLPNCFTNSLHYFFVICNSLIFHCKYSHIIPYHLNIFIYSHMTWQSLTRCCYSQCSKEIKKKAQEQKGPSLMDIELTSMGYRLSPQELIHYAKKVFFSLFISFSSFLLRITFNYFSLTFHYQNHCKIIAFTYNEPTIFLEYAMDVATLAKKEGMKCIFKSNGFESAYTLEKLAPLIDAFNIDLKSFNDSFYQKVCHSRLQPVLDCIRTLHEKGIWVEVTTLLINGLNDSDEELEKIAKFIYEISPDIPWHITPFRPEYKMQDKEYYISFEKD